MRYGKTPTQFLAETNSAEITELFAYFSLEHERNSGEGSDNVDDQLRAVFGKKNV